MPTKTVVTGTIQNVAGNLATSGYVEFQLQPNSNSLTYRVSGTAIIAPNTVRATINASGLLKAENGTDPLELWGNDVLTPASTWYRAKFFPDGVATQTWNLLLIYGATYDLASPIFFQPAEFVPNESPPRFQEIQSSIIPAYSGQYTLGTDQAKFASAYIQQLFADTLNILDFSLDRLIVEDELVIPSYPFASLPASSSPTAGSIARVTDNLRDLWMDTGEKWASVTGAVNALWFAGVFGDGINDDTAGLNIALDYCYLNNKGLYLPSGTYMLSESSGGSGYALLNKGVSMVGGGMFSTIFKAKATLPNTADFIRFKPDAATNVDFVEFRRFSVQPTNTAVKYGRNAIRMDFSNQTAVAKLLVADLYLLPGNDYSIDVENDTGVNVQGVPAVSTFTRCYFAEGLKMIGIGDSNNITESVMRASGGSRIGVLLTMTVASGTAGHTAIERNNIVCPGGAVKATAGRNIKIRDNNIEQVEGAGTAAGAVVDLDGSSGLMGWCEVVSNHIGMFGTTTATIAIRIHGAAGATLDRNTLGAGIVIAKAIDITSSALYTNIGFNEIGTGFTTPVTNAGLKTYGTLLAITLVNSWANTGGSEQTASYFKHVDGSVTITGTIDAPATPDGVGIGTLAAGYRPALTQRASVAAIVSAAVAPQEISVDSGGNIVFHGSNSTTRISINMTFPTLNYVAEGY